jgi:gamma-glutamylaminecyclotransferase
MTHKVFVYGTLRQGFRNHHVMETAGVLVGPAITQGRHLLALLRPTDIPALFHPMQAGQGSFIQGEVYQVDDWGLAVLDRLERHPGWYSREDIPVLLGGQDSPFMAWCYFMPGQPQSDQPVIPTGDYADAARLFR